jgi:hypothetical protein
VFVFCRQETIQCKIVEDVYRLLQLPSHRCNYRWENLLLSWR